MKKILTLAVAMFATFAHAQKISMVWDTQFPDRALKTLPFLQAATPELDVYVREAGATYTDLSGKTAEFSYGTASNASAFVTVEHASIDTANGIITFEFTAVDLNTNGVFWYTITIKEGTKTHYAGDGALYIRETTLTGNPGELDLSSPLNLGLYTITGSLALERLAQGGATTGQVLSWDGDSYAPATIGGDITAVTAGTGLTGGGTSGDVTVNVDTDTIATRAWVGDQSYVPWVQTDEEDVLGLAQGDVSASMYLVNPNPTWVDHFVLGFSTVGSVIDSYLHVSDALVWWDTSLRATDGTRTVTLANGTDAIDVSGGDVDMNGNSVKALPADAYDSGWDGDSTAPRKDDVYDGVEALRENAASTPHTVTSAATITIDPDDGNHQRLAVGQNTTITLSTESTSYGYTIVLDISASSYSVGWTTTNLDGTGDLSLSTSDYTRLVFSKAYGSSTWKVGQIGD